MKKLHIAILLIAILVSTVIVFVIIGNAWSAHQIAERAQEGFFKR